MLAQQRKVLSRYFAYRPYPGAHTIVYRSWDGLQKVISKLSIPKSPRSSAYNDDGTRNTGLSLTQVSYTGGEIVGIFNSTFFENKVDAYIPHGECVELKGIHRTQVRQLIKES